MTISSNHKVIGDSTCLPNKLKCPARKVTLRKQKTTARPGSVYIAVTGTALLVSLVGFTAIHLSRLEVRSVSTLNNLSYARALAQTGVEFALSRIDSDSSWRSNYTHGTENSTNPMGRPENIVFKFLDNHDGNLADDPTEPVEIQGIGRHGGATFVYTVEYKTSITSYDQVGPVEFRSYTTSGGNSTGDTVAGTKWWGQYFVPTLPGEAISWSVTSVEVQIKKSGSANATLNFALHLPNGSQLPGTTLETINVNESSLPGTYDWHEVNFSNVTELSPAVGLCLAISTADSSAANIQYESAGVAQPNAHLISGSGAWTNTESGQSLFYRINGVYATGSGSGEFTISPGSWRRVEAP